jgi:hypothetical protein
LPQNGFHFKEKAVDDTDTDQLLEKLRLVHGEPRFDIAPELIAAKRQARAPAANT